MKKTELRFSGRAGMISGLICATLGMLAAFAILIGLGFINVVKDTGQDPLIGIFAGILVLYLWAALMGRAAGKVAYYCGNHILINFMIGIIMALTSLVIAIVAGFLTEFFVGKWHGLVKWSYMPGAFAAIFSPILEIGIIPAFFLGLLYGLLINWWLIKIVSPKEIMPEFTQEA